MDRHLNFIDKMNSKDTNIIKYNNDTDSYEKKVKNRVIIRNELGEVISDDTNEVILQGSFCALSKLFNADPPFKFQTLNEKLGVDTGSSNRNYEGFPREFIFNHFIIGDDGCNITFGDVQKVVTYKNGPESLIPFRRVPVSKDLSFDEQSRYSLKREVDGYYEYFAKKFETKPIIKAVFKDTGEEVPHDINTQILAPEREAQIEKYALIKLKISKNEAREFFDQVGDGIDKARVNTISLVMGYEEEDTDTGRILLKEATPSTQYNFNNEPLDNEAKELYVDYMVFI